VSQARRVLAALMHAAALGGASMRDVLGWVADPGSGEQDILLYLRLSPEPSAVQDARQFLDTNDRTRSSITTTIMPALAWLADPGAWAATQPVADRSRIQLDIAQLVELRGAVFLIGAEEAQTAPLVTALTGYIAREARRLAGLSPAGRLDPGLTLVLDEAALICPVPLPQWTSDMGGRSISIHIGAQSFQQLIDRFGQAAANAILTNAGTVLVYGGTRSKDDLALYSMLGGERHEVQTSWDANGRVTSSTTRLVPVISAGMIAQLKTGRVLIHKRGMFPMIGRVQMAWTRTDVKWAKRTQRWAERADAFVARAAYTRGAVALLVAEAAASVRPRWARLRERVSGWALHRFVRLGWRIERRHSERRARRLVDAAQRRGRERDL
jgi:hypothetical protein